MRTTDSAGRLLRRDTFWVDVVVIVLGAALGVSIAAVAGGTSIAEQWPVALAVGAGGLAGSAGRRLWLRQRGLRTD